MSLHIDRKCCICSKVNENEIYINWDMESEGVREAMDKFYNEWTCSEECRDLHKWDVENSFKEKVNQLESIINKLRNE